MRLSELLRLVWLNISQNKFKTVLTSVGIVVGAATIVMVIAIGRGGQMDVAEQFSSLNAGAIDISYDYAGDEAASGGGFSLGNISGMISNVFGNAAGNIRNMFSGGFGGGGGNAGEGANADADAGGPGGGSMGGGNGGPGGGMGEGGNGGFGGGMGDLSDRIGAMAENGEMPDVSAIFNELTGQDADEEDGGEEDGGEEDGGEEDGGEEDAGEEDADEDVGEEEEGVTADRLNRENIVLSESDLEDLELFVPGISGATISYTTQAEVEGGDLTEAATYPIAGVYDSYYTVSNLKMAEGEFLTDQDNDLKSRVCVLGSQTAKALFGSAADAEGETLYLDDRAYTIVGVLASASTVSANITPDESIFIPYSTGIKYITGENIDPVITVISEDVNAVSDVIADSSAVLTGKYSTAEFTFADAGSKMEAAESSNETLTLLLTAMAVIVFLVGGIGIMNVLFVSVRERTEEIGILKALGSSRSNILFEFLFESAAISLIGGVIGVAISFAVTPIIEYYGIRVEANITAWVAALLFSVLTGTIFGFYPAWQASRLVPVEALNAE